MHKQKYIIYNTNNFRKQIPHESFTAYAYFAIRILNAFRTRTYVVHVVSVYVLTCKIKFMGWNKFFAPQTLPKRRS